MQSISGRLSNEKRKTIPQKKSVIGIKLSPSTKCSTPKNLSTQHNKELDKIMYLRNLEASLDPATVKSLGDSIYFVDHGNKGLYNALITKDLFSKNVLLKRSSELKNFMDDFVCIHDRKVFFNGFKRALKIWKDKVKLVPAECPLMYFEFLVKTAQIPSDTDISKMKKKYNELVKDTKSLNENNPFEAFAKVHAKQWFKRNKQLREGKDPEYRWFI